MPKKSHPVAPPGGLRHGGKNYKAGQRLPAKYARVVGDGQVSLDPARGVSDAPPNFGRDLLPQILTFGGRFSTVNQVYRNPDLAYSQGEYQARIMRNDCAIMECLEARQRGTALLNWHLEPEDKKDERQKKLADDLTDILQATPDFTEYRRNLLEAIWYGRYAVQHAYGWQIIKGQRRCVVKRWQPVNGDKLVFRFDDGSGKYSGDEVGIRVGAAYGRKDALAGDRKIDYTEQGPVYFLEPWERSRLALHKHIIEDGVYEDALSAGRIHGVGVRDRIYWCWYQKQETLAQLMELIQRTGSGITLYRYPAHDPAAKTAVEAVAKENTNSNVILVPTLPGDTNFDSYGIERIEPSTAGIEALKGIIHEFFGWQIKRYIVGQVRSSEPVPGGIGTSDGDLQKDTFNQIIAYDAVKLEETISRETVKPIKDFNMPWARDISVRFVIDTESSDAERKLTAYKGAWDMGLRIKAADVYDSIGASMPTADDEVLQNPQMAGGMPGQPGGQPGMDPGAQEGDLQHLFGPLADDLGGGDEPDEGEPGPGPDNDEPDAPKGPVQYAAALAADPRWKTKHQPGETMSKGGVTYVLNSHHRWERSDKDEADSPEAHNAETIDANETPNDGDDHAARHEHVAKALAKVDPQASGLIKAFHASPDYQGGGDVAGQKLDPSHAGKLHSWLSQSAAKGDGPAIIMPDGKRLKSSHVGGGIAVDFGDGRTGFASEAGSFVVGKDGKANYTTKTGIVAGAMAGKPMLNPPGQNPAMADTQVQPQGAQPNGMQGPDQAAAPVAQGPAPAGSTAAPALQTVEPDQKSRPEQQVRENPHRAKADKAHAAWQDSVKGMENAIANGADAKDLAAWGRYVGSKRRVFREYDQAANHHDKQQKRLGGKGPKTSPPANDGLTDDERAIRDKFGIDPKQTIKPTQGVDPSRPKFGTPEDKAAAREKPSEAAHAHHAAVHEALASQAANEPDDAKASAMAAQAVTHGHLAEYHSSAVHSESVKSAIESAHAALHKAGLAEKPDEKGAMARLGIDPSAPKMTGEQDRKALAERMAGGAPLAEAPEGQGGYVAPSDEALAKVGKLGQKSDGADALKKSVKKTLVNHDLHTHDRNVNAIHEAIDKGYITSPEHLKSVMGTAKRLHQSGRMVPAHNKRTAELQNALAKSDDKGRRAIQAELDKHQKYDPSEDTHAAVQEAIRRKAGRKESARENPESMANEGAKYWSEAGGSPMSADEYKELAKQAWEQGGDEDYANGVKALREHTGIKSAKAAQNNDEGELSDEIYMVFQEHPALGVAHDAGQQELEDAAWELLKSDDGKGVPPPHSKAYWDRADKMIGEMMKAGQSGGPGQAATDDSLQSVPFSATWRDGYRRMVYAKKLKSTPGQKGIFDGYDHHANESTDRAPYDEKKHSRGQGGAFRHIGAEDNAGQAKIGFDESKHPREAAGKAEGGRFTAAHHAVGRRFGIPPEAVKSVLETHPDELAKRDNYFPPSSARDEAVGPTLDYEQHPLGTAKIDHSRHKSGDTDNAPVDYLREFDPHSLKMSEAEDGVRHAGSTEKYVEWLKAGHKPPPINVYDSSNGNGDLISGNRRRTLAAQMADAGPITGWHGVENKETGLPLKYGDVKRAHAEAEGGKSADAPFALGNDKPKVAGEKFENLGGQQEKMFHGMDSLPGQQDLFEGLDLGGGGHDAHVKVAANAGIQPMSKEDFTAQTRAILAKRLTPKTAE